MSSDAQPWRFATDYPGGMVWWNDLSVARWGEHIAWAMRLLEAREPGLFAVADYGSSPLSLLGSSLTMPIDQGWTERMGSSFLCLDASHQRLAVVPGLFGQLPISTLIVRGQALLPLDDLCRRNGVVLEKTGVQVIVTLDRAPAPNMIRAGFDYLLVDEASLLIAPVCRRCGHAHLRRNHYRVEADTLHNVVQDGLAGWELPSGISVAAGACAAGHGDGLLAVAGLTGRAVEAAP
jgi:hypothetical protein